MSYRRERQVKHLKWIRARLHKVHGEDEYFDYMIRLDEIIKELEEDEQQMLNYVVSVKEAFADYAYSEGCGCCEDTDRHNEAADKLGKLLGFDRYDDDSGWDFYAHAKLYQERQRQKNGND